MAGATQGVDKRIGLEYNVTHRLGIPKPPKRPR